MLFSVWGEQIYMIGITFHPHPNCNHVNKMLQLNGSVKNTKHPDVFYFRPSLDGISNVLFTGGRGVSDFSVLKYY